MKARLMSIFLGIRIAAVLFRSPFDMVKFFGDVAGAMVLIQEVGGRCGCTHKVFGAMKSFWTE